MNDKKVLAIIFVILGGVGELLTLLRICEDMEPVGEYYTYQFPLTSHESIMIALAVICAVLFVSGLYWLSKNKEE